MAGGATFRAMTRWLAPRWSRSIPFALALAPLAAAALADTAKPSPAKPDAKPGGYSHVVEITGPGRIVYIVTHNINEFSRVPGLSIDDWEV